MTIFEEEFEFRKICRAVELTEMHILTIIINFTIETHDENVLMHLFAILRDKKKLCCSSNFIHVNLQPTSWLISYFGFPRTTTAWR